MNEQSTGPIATNAWPASGYRAIEQGGTIMNVRSMTLALFAIAALAEPGSVQAQTKLTVAMPTNPPNIVHMPVHIAKDLGLFKKYGVDVETFPLEGGVHAYRAMVAGNADISSASGPFSIVGRSKGAPSKIILANSPKLEASMIAQANIKTLADLKGKRIGIQEPNGFADVLSRGVLRAAKIDPKEVSFVGILSEDVPPLVAGQIDTAILHVEQEMIAVQKAPGLHAIARLWELQPKNLYNVMVVMEKTLASKRAALVGYVKGHIEATRLLYTDKAKVMPILVKYTGLPADVLSKALDFMVKECIWDANHGLTPSRISFTTELMERVGNIDKGKAPKYEEAIDISLAEEAIKELGEWKGPICPSDPS
jgi:NitT/TauT family transport system substrate-binding protein